MQDIKKAVILFSLLAISPLFGSDGEKESLLHRIRIVEVAGDIMPGSEREIIELYHNEEGNPLPVVFRGAAKNWGAASWTPQYFAEHFGENEIVVMPRVVVEGQKKMDELIRKLSEIESSICPAPKTIIQTCDEDGLACRNQCSEEDEKGFYHQGVDIQHQEYEDLSDKLKQFEEKMDHMLVASTIKDYISSILLNPNDAGLLGLTAELVEESELSENVNNPFKKNIDFANFNLNLATQTQFPLLGEDIQGAIGLIIVPENFSSDLGTQSSSEFCSQIYGKKAVELVHPKHTRKCSCSDKSELCAIDISTPDFEKHSELKDIEVYQTILEPGDVLYIPAHWLRKIQALSTDISIEYGE